MHSPSALTELSSPNLAGTFSHNPVVQKSQRRRDWRTFIFLRHRRHSLTKLVLKFYGRFYSRGGIGTISFMAIVISPREAGQKFILASILASLHLHMLIKQTVPDSRVCLAHKICIASHQIGLPWTINEQERRCRAVAFKGLAGLSNVCKGHHL